jgi:hypothetical protein
MRSLVNPNGKNIAPNKELNVPIAAAKSIIGSQTKNVTSAKNANIDKVCVPTQ